MIIGGLIALFSMLMGADGLPFLIPKEEKAVKKVIVDKERRQKLKILFQKVADKEKAYNKDRKRFFKLLDETTNDQNSTAEDFARLGDDFQAVNAGVYDFMVDIRLSLGSYLTDEEWDAIIEFGKEEFYKADRSYEKAWPKFDKKINQLNARIRVTMVDEQKALIIQEKLTAFGLLTLKNAKALNTYNVYENEVYNDIHSTKAELENVSSELLALRAEVFDEYVEIHKMIANNTSEQEWKKIVKSLNKLF